MCLGPRGLDVKAATDLSHPRFHLREPNAFAVPCSMSKLIRCRKCSAVLVSRFFEE